MIGTFQPGDLARPEVISRVAGVTREHVERIAHKLGLRARYGEWLPALVVIEEISRMADRQHQRLRRAKLRHQAQAAPA